MKLICSQPDLSSALSIVNRAVSPNNTLPVLNNILVRAEGRRVFLSATNLEIAINASFEADVQNEGALTIPAKTITAYVSLLANKPVELTVQSGASLELKAEGSKTMIKGIPAEEFPLLPTLNNPDTFKLPVAEFREAIDCVSFAASTNISRPVLTGIYCQINGAKLKLAATDSYRLSEKTITLEKDTGVDLSFIVPSRTAIELAKILSGSQEKEVEVRVSKGQVMFKADGVELMSRLIEGNYPDYEKILPKDAKIGTTMNREEFSLALRKVSVLVKDYNNNVKVRLGDGKLVVFSDETQLGHGTVELPVDAKGETVEVSLNVQYLLDVLGHVDGDEVKIGLNDGLSPVKVEPVKASGTLHIIMPLKV